MMAIPQRKQIWNPMELVQVGFVRWSSPEWIKHVWIVQNSIALSKANKDDGWKETPRTRSGYPNDDQYELDHKATAFFRFAGRKY